MGSFGRVRGGRQSASGIGAEFDMKTWTGADVGVRRARPNDAEEASAVVCASIADLCAADHGGEPEILARWLANRTPPDVQSWIETPGRVLVAEERRRIVGVGAGAAAASGMITLNYVLPKMRFHGVSKAVLSALEAYLRAEVLLSLHLGVAPARSRE